MKKWTMVPECRTSKGTVSFEAGISNFCPARELFFTDLPAEAKAEAGFFLLTVSLPNH